MEKSAENISSRKFRQLTHRQCHKLLAALAEKALARSDPKAFSAFVQRYEEMTSWVSVDRYYAPLWLTPREAMEEYYFFHRQFSQGTGENGFPHDAVHRISWEEKIPIDIALDQVRSPYNVGSILRIMDNFGFRTLIHATRTLSLDHPQLKKAARGCETWIPVRYSEALHQELDQSDRPVVALELEDGAVPLASWKPPGPCTVILGNETYGISKAIRELCSQVVHIPMSGYKKSMNVSHAFAIFACHCAMCFPQETC